MKVNTKKRKLAIYLKNISKKYTLRHEKNTLIESFFRRVNKESFFALKKINLEIYQGEKVALIGSNGAGKTTLLKIISGITKPTSGTVRLKGSVISIIDLSAGFHPDLSGEENIYLNGLFVGMNKQQINDKFKEIVKFADIGKFIDAPFYTYSSGMKLRLGFSIAVHADPDVLIFDEAVAAGDMEFQKKARKTVEKLFKANKTIVVVTHWDEFIKKNCNRIIWLEQSRIFKDGDINIIDEYLNQ